MNPSYLPGGASVRKSLKTQVWAGPTKTIEMHLWCGFWDWRNQGPGFLSWEKALLGSYLAMSSLECSQYSQPHWEGGRSDATSGYQSTVSQQWYLSVVDFDSCQHKDWVVCTSRCCICLWNHWQIPVWSEPASWGTFQALRMLDFDLICD